MVAEEGAQAEKPTQTLARVLHALLPDRPLELIENCLDQVDAPDVVLVRATRLLERRPGVISQGLEDVDSRVQWMLLGLIKAGLTEVVLPTCPSCGRHRPVPRRTTVNGVSVRVCDTCFNASRRSICEQCGKIRLIYRTVKGKGYCRKCSSPPAPSATCSRCGRTNEYVSRRKGEVICLNCIPKARYSCAECGQTRPRARLIGEHGFCHMCYKRITKVLQECPSCRQERIVAHRSPRFARVCASCSGEPPRYRCTQCEREGRRFGGRCGQCAVRAIRDDLRRQHPRADPRWGAFFELLVNSPTVENAVVWLGSGVARSTITRLHADLSDAASELRAVTQLRARRNLETLLVNAGLLDRTEVTQWQIEDYLDATGADLGPDSRLVLTQFVRWHLMKRASRPRHRQGPGSTQPLHHLRSEIRATAALLLWTEDHGLEPAALKDRRIWVLFVHDHPTLRSALRAFGAWFFRVTKSNPVPLVPARSPKPVLGHREHRSALRTLVANDQLRLDLRCIASLIGLFGVTIETACALRRDQFVTDRDGGLQVTFGVVPVDVPPPFDTLVRQQLYRLGPNLEVVFPGRVCGTSISSQTMRKHARRALVGTLEALRRAGLENLAAEVPASVVADVTGYTPQAVTRIAARLGRPWSDYPALRDTDHWRENLNQPCGPELGRD